VGRPLKKERKKKRKILGEKDCFRIPELVVFPGKKREGRGNQKRKEAEDISAKDKQEPTFLGGKGEEIA